MKFYINNKEIIKLEKQEKVTLQELENLKARLKEMFKRFKDQYKKIEK